MEQRWPREAWLDALWDAEGVRPNERCVAYVYYRFAGRKPTSWCSWSEISRRTGIRSKDAINRAIRGLIDAHWLAEEESARQHRSAVYRLTVPPEVRETDFSEVRETDLRNAEVRETAPEVRETGVQRYGKRDATNQIELLEEASSRAREPQPDIPDRLRPSVDFITRNTGCVAADAVGAVSLLERERPDIRYLPGFLTALAAGGELAGWVERARSERARGEISRFLDYAKTQPECREHLVPGGDLVRPDTGKRVCRLCQQLAERAA